MRIRQLFHIRAVCGRGSARCRSPGRRGAAADGAAGDGAAGDGAAGDGAARRPTARRATARRAVAAATGTPGTDSRGPHRRKPHPCDVEPVNPVSQSFALQDIPVSCGRWQTGRSGKSTAGREVGAESRDQRTDAGLGLAPPGWGPNDLNGGGCSHSRVPAAAPAPVTPPATRPGLR